MIGAGLAASESSTPAEALRSSEARLRLLSRTAGRLLASEDPQSAVDELCREVMAHLDCQVFFNFLAEPEARKLRLNACAGISAEEARRIEWLDYGVAICGCVARDGRRIVAEDLAGSSDSRAALVRSYGVQAYCCHPLHAEGKLLGTLSFGTTNRGAFSPDDVELMRTVTDQVATAMQRLLAKRSLARANERLLEADRRKDEFLAVLSHELRNPLAAIATSLHVLDHEEAGEDGAVRARAVIGRQVTHLTGLVNDLLDVTRITRNLIQLRREPLDLDEEVRRAVEDHRALFERVGVELELRAADRPVPVEADPTRLAQVVGNLLQNAAKFCRSGGRTIVSVEAEAPEARVRVVDDGVGMTPGTLGRLFRPFVQAEQTLDRSQGGLGLGLALVKGLVEQHDGRVEAISEGPGRGSEFVVTLPLQTAAPIVSEVESTSQAGVARRVLVIEDNRDAAESLRDVLELGDHEVALAHSGPDGVEAARRFRPDLIICDIGLPGMDGYEVARTLRADPDGGAVRLVALSGYAQPEDVRRAREAGFDRHLAKPPSIEALEKLIEEIPARAGASGAPPA